MRRRTGARNVCGYWMKPWPVKLHRLPSPTTRLCYRECPGSSYPGMKGGDTDDKFFVNKTY